MKASTIDQSWFEFPNVTHIGAYHVDKGDGTAACGQIGFLNDRKYDLKDVAVPLRCRRNGCRQHFERATK